MQPAGDNIALAQPVGGSTDVTTLSAAPRPTTYAWLRNPKFDVVFLLGLPALAVATGLVVATHPAWFWPILVFDLWFLGYHHVISTYTRLCFDRQSFAASRWLIFGLIPAVAVGTILIAALFGLWAVISLYFYWQWFHYARQSWGISRAYRAKEPGALYEDGWLDRAMFYGVPVWGILNRSHQDPGTFIGMPLTVIPVSSEILSLSAIIGAFLLAAWVLRRVYAWRSGLLARVHTLYVSTHYLIFAVGYLLLDDLTYGWLAINIWHNAQYILFVWLFNTRRFKDGIQPQARFLSYISQAHRLWLYLLTGVAITGVVYVGVIGSLNALFFAGLSATVVLYQVVNFHHYIVDALIWRVRKPAMRKNLGLAG
jgi:hypothetical protein